MCTAYIVHLIMSLVLDVVVFVMSPDITVTGRGGVVVMVLGSELVVLRLGGWGLGGGEGATYGSLLYEVGGGITTQNVEELPIKTRFSVEKNRNGNV